MDASQDWRSGLTASERYDNIQKLFVPNLLSRRI